MTEVIMWGKGGPQDVDAQNEAYRVLRKLPEEWRVYKTDTGAEAEKNRWSPGKIYMKIRLQRLFGEWVAAIVFDDDRDRKYWGRRGRDAEHALRKTRRLFNHQLLRMAHVVRDLRAAEPFAKSAETESQETKP